MKRKLVVAVGSDKMGQGDESLGKILMKAFIYSLTELNEPPAALLLYNAGARIVLYGENTVHDLKTLAARGCEILICGTCVNYYKMQDSIAVGTVSNMRTITQMMSEADNLINI